MSRRKYLEEKRFPCDTGGLCKGRAAPALAANSLDRKRAMGLSRLFTLGMFPEAIFFVRPRGTFGQNFLSNTQGVHVVMLNQAL